MKPLLLAYVVLLSACNNPTPPPKVGATTSNPIFDTQIQAMKKARAVEGQVNAATEAQRKQIEQTEKP